MSNFFNKLKSGIDALTGSPERTLELAKNALTKVEGVYFREDNGVLTEKIDATDTFKYKVVRRLIPEKKTLTLEVVIDTIADNDYADRAARFDFGTPLLNGGAKNGQPCVTAVFKDASLNNPEALADAIKSALEALDSKIEEFAAGLGLLLVNPTPSAIRAALKKRSDVDVSTVNPLKQTAQPTGVFVTVKVKEFKYYKLRLAGFEGCIYPTFYLTNINADADKVIRIFSDNNFKALRLEDDSVKVHGEFIPNDFRTIKRLESCLSAYIDALTKSLRQINEICPLGDPQLHGKVFDCWGIEEVFLERKDFKNYKQEGVITLSTPAGADGFKFAKNTIIGVLPSKVTVSSEVDASLKNDLAAEKVIADFNKKSADIQAEITAGGSLKVVGVENASAYYDVNSVVIYGLKNAVELLDKVSDTLPELLKALGVESRTFILSDVRQTLKSIYGFNKIDDDGDVYFKFGHSERFVYTRYVWVYVKLDRLRFQAGISNFKAEMPIEKALEKVNATFKNNNDGISYKISNDAIRAEKSLYRKDLADVNLTGQIKKAAEQIINELNAAMEKVVEICGMPPFVLNRDTFKMACLKADLTEVHGRQNAFDMFEWDFGTMSLNDGSTILVEIKRTPIGMIDDLRSDIKQLDNRIERVQFCSKSTDLYIRQLSYNTFESLVSDLRNLHSLGNRADDAVIAHNKKVKKYKEEQEAFARAKAEAERRAEAEAERRRQREAEERAKRAQLERELNTEYGMSIGSGTDVRWIQKAFNEWFPYLRLGIFMVKTAQGADRNSDTISSYDLDTTMQQIRSFKGGGRITIYGRSTPADVEKEFRSRCGLVVKVCYTDPNNERYYISKTNSLYKKSLVEIERQFKKEGGYYRNDWY